MTKDIEREALEDEIELFIGEAMKAYVVERWAVSYENSNPFSHTINDKNDVWWMKAQAKQLWDFWQAAKAQAVPEGCVVAPKSEATDWYLDENEYIYTDEPDIFLCDLKPGEVWEVKRQLCWQVESQFAAKVYEDEDNINWDLFDSKNDAEKAAAHCKAMVEAQEPSND